ncbi:hypothetical protein EW026_g2895 [Hermanssonia centrifuga]|uniref:Uncharacterized protein n=1 Tax=Hermanssonia centrifuga TaxID=98765 RepID=A0A4S4KMV4_9APHY|nr:hypothetical protein EW026_g2895 [Hermanssonia centrifuga]
MPPDEEPHIRHGTYVLPANVSAPNAARTLVMELLPKKFRSLAFVRQWAMEFCPKPPVALRMELDIKAGSDDDMDYDAVEEREKPPIQEHLPDLEYADEVITADDVYVASSQCGSHPPVVFPGQDDLIIIDSLWQAVPSGLQSPVVPVHAPAPRLPFPGDTMTMKTASHFIGGQLAGSYPSFIRPDSLQTEDSPNPSLPARIASPSGPPSTVPTPSVRSTISTPTPPPSEPRAMKNAPKGPTYVKRALLARQKELEEKIAKSKEHLATHSSGTATPDSTGEVSEGASEESVRRKLSFESNTHGRLEQTTDEKEDFLRQLVLQSKRKKALVVAYGPLTTIGGEEHPSTSIIMNQGPLIPQQVIVADDKPSLDDLASSFIAESIQLILQPAAYTQDNDNAAKIPEDRAKLVARQNIVNTCLKESKELLDKLATARTKEEKAELRKAFNESTRKKEAALEVLESLCDSPPVRSCATPVERFVWPRDSNAVVFVISDDEGEDEDEDDKD